jgi:oligoendopeptidase F
VSDFMFYLIQNNIHKQSWYFEVSEVGTVFRQILLEQGKESKVSNQKKYDFFLSETELDLEDPILRRIAKEEFERVWNEVNKDQEDIWNKKKEIIKCGTKIKGFIEVFYPQGVVVNIPEYDVLGLANYEECATNSHKRNMHKDLVVYAEVIGYDDVNYWIILGNPKVLDTEYI